jgi:HK97 family phage major capsid protein
MSITTAKAKREERASLIAQMNEITGLVATEDRSMTSDEMQTFDRLDEAQKGLLEQAETLERVERSSALTTQASIKEDRQYKHTISHRDVNNAIKGFFSAGVPDARPTDEQRQAAEKCGINLGSQYLTIRLRDQAPASLHEARAAQTVTTSAGGYTIENAAMQPLEVALLAYGGMRRVADVIRTETGGTLPFPTANDTSNVGRLLSINTQVTDTALTFGQKTLGAYKYSSDLILCPIELLQDTAINLPQYIGEALGERLGRITNTHYTTGDGSSKPRGLFADTSAGKTAASTSAITWPELVDLEHSIDPAYRNAPGVGWMMHDTTFAQLKKLVDDNNRPLWLPGVANGAPDTFLGYGVYINQDVATVAAGAKAIAFGDFKKFKIRDVLDVTVKRLDERYADYAQVAFIGFLRTDSALVFSSGSVPVKHLVMAAS